MTAVRVATAASRYDRYQPEHHAFEDARHRPEPEPHRKLHDLGLSAQILTRSVSEVRADALLMLFEVAVFAWFSAESTACISHGRKSMETLMHSPSVLKGRQENCGSQSLAPAVPSALCGGSLTVTTDLRPWLMHAVTS